MAEGKTFEIINLKTLPQIGKSGGEGNKQGLKSKGQQWLLRERERERELLGSRLGREGHYSDGENVGVSTWVPWARYFFAVWGCPVYYRIFSSIPGPSLLLHQMGQQNWLQTLPSVSQGSESPLVENHWCGTLRPFQQAAVWIFVYQMWPNSPLLCVGLSLPQKMLKS